MPQVKVNFGPKVGGAKKTFPPEKKAPAGLGSKPGKVNPFLKNDAAKKQPAPEAKPAAPAPAAAVEKAEPAPPKEVTVDISSKVEIKVELPPVQQAAPATAEPPKPKEPEPAPEPKGNPLKKMQGGRNKHVRIGKKKDGESLGEPPKFVDSLEPKYSVDEGNSLIIDCICEGDPEPDVDWYFKEKVVKDEGRYKYFFEKGNVIGLEVSKVTADDAGEYKCVCFNASGKAESKSTISVKVKAKEVEKPKEPEPVKKPSPKPVRKEEPKVEAPKPKAEPPKPKAEPPKPKAEPPKPKAESPPSTDTSSSAPIKQNTSSQKRRDKKNKLPIEREGIRAENPEKYYEFGDEIGRGKFAVVKYATNKSTGQKYAAKIIKFDSDSIKFAIREYDLMVERINGKGLVKLHEAFLVRKYLILIMDLVDGKTFLDKVATMHSITEDDVASFIKQLLEILQHMHVNNLVHLDLRPTNIRFSSGRDVVILDYNSCRHIPNKKAGAVVDVIGDTEFCAPEMLNFDPVSQMSDVWSIGVLAYILLTGISPFYYEDEEQVVSHVQKAKFDFVPDFENVSSNAKDFIKKIFLRAPEMRLNAEKALAHDWLNPDFAAQRKRNVLKIQDVLRETDERLYSEEEEEYVWASLVFRTFDEDEYDSPEDSDDEEEE